MIAAALGLCWLVPCAWTDGRTGRLPRPLTLTGLALALALRLILIAADPAGRWPALAWGLAVGAAALWLHRRPDRRGRERLGGGDVPLLTGLALLCPVLLGAGWLAGTAWLAAVRLRRGPGRPAPLAPALCGGWGIATGIIAWHPALSDPPC